MPDLVAALLRLAARGLDIVDLARDHRVHGASSCFVAAFCATTAG